jgi:TonB-linked SusC/RagA family outer membrane protein
MKRILLLSISFLFVLGSAWAQRTVSGRVTSDSDGSGIPGVNVILKGTTTGTTSDLDGNYRVSVPEEGGTLVFSFIGLATQEVEIGARSVVDVAMSEDVETLSEVVVTALGFSREKKALGYGVTTISNAAVENRQQADIGRILRGKAPGVDIAQTSGMTGTGTNIIVRGYSSISGSNQPLFVIDGVPFNTDTNADQNFATGGSTASSRFLDLDPNNIAEISILKGLSATVLYGEAGRNGVILVTTKTGRGGSSTQDMDVRFSQDFAWQQVANLPDYQDTYGNGFSGNFGWFFSNWGPAFDVRGSNGIDENGQVVHPYDQPQYNDDFPEFAGQRYDYRPYQSVENFFQTGLRSNTSVGFDKNLGSGSSVSFNYSYLDDAGFIPENKNRFQKHNFSFGGTTELNNGIKINTSVNYVDSDLLRPPASIGYGSNPVGASLFANLIYTPRSIDLLNLPYQSPLDGSMVYYRRGSAIDNPRWVLNNAFDTETVRRYFGAVNVSYSITDWLLFTYRIGLDQYTQNSRRQINKGGSQVLDGQLVTVNRLNTINDQVYNLAVNRNITEDISFDALVGLNVRRETRDQTFATSQEQFIFNLFNHGNFINHQNFQFVQEENTIGAYMTASFGYRDFVYLNFQGRNDWTSTLEEENRSIFYPSGSVSFVPTDAIPSLSNNVLDFLKLRLGYGTSAGYPNPYQTRNFLGSATRVFLDPGGTAMNINTVSDRLGNPNLAPELHTELEFGLEARLLDSRIGVDMNLYNKQSRDLIIARELDPAAGFTQTTINSAEIENKGIELGINLNPVRNPVNVSLDLNFTRNVNKVISIADGIDQLPIPVANPLTGQAEVVTTAGAANWVIPGEWYGVIQGIPFVRDEGSGELLVSGIGDYQPEQDIDVIGNPNPDWMGNAGITLSWKGLSAYAQFQYTAGGDIYSFTAGTMLARGNTVDTDVDRFLPVILPGVKQDADGNIVPNDIQGYLGDYAFNAYFFADEGLIFDGTVIRLREASLSYDLPKSLLENTPLGLVTVRLTGQNLWFKAPNFPEGVNYDPEVLKI